MAQEWYCPNCDANAQTVTARIPHHPCPGTGGLMIPLTRVGQLVKIEAREREDYVGKELVQTDTAGRPIMSIVTTRDDGQDVTVLPPTARVERE